jgi:serine/threonine protein kinase
VAYRDDIYEHVIYSSKKEIPFSHVEPLGHGSFGYVDKIKRTKGPLEGRAYARKTTRMPLDGFAQTIKDILENEAKIIKMVCHLRVICIAGTYSCERDFAILMSPVADADLEEYLHRVDTSPLEEGLELRQRMTAWFGCLSSGLAYLHAQGIRHRDIKPSNILVTVRDVLLTDFSIALEKAEDTTVTFTDTIGTKMYHAPEIANSIRSGRPGDIFSLDAVFLEILTAHSGSGQLASFKKFRETDGDRLYRGTLSKVYEWIDIVEDDPHWHQDNIWGLTVLLLCRYGGKTAPRLRL